MRRTLDVPGSILDTLYIAYQIFISVHTEQKTHNLINAVWKNIPASFESYAENIKPLFGHNVEF
jgi:hypothetical protein